MFNWIQFLTYAVSTTMTPGPNNIMSMSNASRVGLKKSYPFNIGIWCGFSIVMIICALFTSALSALIPKIRKHQGMLRQKKPNQTRPPKPRLKTLKALRNP